MQTWPVVRNRVAWSVSLSIHLLVCLSHSEPCNNSWTNPDAIWVEDSGGPKAPCIRWGPDPPWEGAILRKKGAACCEVYRLIAVSCTKTAEPIEMPFGIWALCGPRKHVLVEGVHWPPPGEYHWTVYVRRRYSLFMVASYVIGRPYIFSSCFFFLLSFFFLA